MTAFPSINPSYTVRVSTQYNTLITSFNNNVSEQRISLSSVPRRTFSLRWAILTPTDKETISDFFEARKGSFESFTWTNTILGASYTVRFKEDTINFEYFNYLMWSCNTVEFIEVSA